MSAYQIGRYSSWLAASSAFSKLGAGRADVVHDLGPAVLEPLDERLPVGLAGDVVGVGALGLELPPDGGEGLDHLVLAVLHHGVVAVDHAGLLHLLGVHLLEPDAAVDRGAVDGARHRLPLERCVGEPGGPRGGGHGREPALAAGRLLAVVEDEQLAHQEELLGAGRGHHVGDLGDLGVVVGGVDLAAVDPTLLVAPRDEGPHGVARLVVEARGALVAGVVAVADADGLVGHALVGGPRGVAGPTRRVEGAEPPGRLAAARRREVGAGRRAVAPAGPCACVGEQSQDEEHCGDSGESPCRSHGFPLVALCAGVPGAFVRSLSAHNRCPPRTRAVRPHDGAHLAPPSVTVLQRGGCLRWSGAGRPVRTHGRRVAPR